MSTSQALVGEGGPRNATHGNFERNAQLSQEMKFLIFPSINGNWSFTAREAMDMICLKFSRILSGRIAEPDHWRDIGGYSQLVYNSEGMKPHYNVRFESAADFSQALKVFIEHNMDPDAAAAASPLQREALDIICHGIGRIMAGGVTDQKNWLMIIEAAEAVTECLETQKAVDKDTEPDTLPSISQHIRKVEDDAQEANTATVLADADR